MIKLLHVLAGILLFSTLGFSQSSFSVTAGTPSHYITEEIEIGPVLAQDVEFHCTVTNTSQTAKHVRASREFITQGTNHQNYICWGPGCYPGFLDISDVNDTVIMQPGESNTTFFGHVKPEEQVGITTMRYCFFDHDNPSDSTCIIVVYDFTPVGINESFSSQLTVGDPYPNPANDQVQIAYDIKGTDSETTVMVYNTVGEVIHSEQVIGTQGLVTLSTVNYAEGLYYVSMQSTDSSLVTRKFIVTK